MEKERTKRREAVAFSLFAALMGGLLFGCSSARQGAETGETEKPSRGAASDSATGVISTDEAVTLITALEQNPLSPDASAQRTILTAWVIASPDVGPLTVNDDVILPFQESDHPYSPELFLQYMFGMARAQATENHPSQRGIIASGLRSLLAAYKSITLIDTGTHSLFLDNLDRARQQGKLEEYIQGVEESRK